MNEFFKVCGYAAVFCASLLILSIKEKEISILISSLLYVVAFLYVITQAGNLLAAGNTYLKIENSIVSQETILKILGIALTGSIVSTLCENVGQKGIGQIIEILAMFEILKTAIPHLKELLECFLKIFGE